MFRWQYIYRFSFNKSMIFHGLRKNGVSMWRPLCRFVKKDWILSYFPHVLLFNNLFYFPLKVNAYLPSGGAVAVSLILEIGYVGHHPLVDLAQGETFFRSTLNGLCDEVGVGQVAPGVSPRRAFFGGRRRGLFSRSRHGSHWPWKTDQRWRSPGPPTSAAATAGRRRGSSHHVLVMGHQAVVSSSDKSISTVRHHEVTLLPHVDRRRWSCVMRIMTLKYVLRLVVHRMVRGQVRCLHQASVQETAMMSFWACQSFHHGLLLHHHFHWKIYS